jgi:TetR/AcrR family transcriptional regulator, cholesterol catabolism regulator
MTTERLLEIVRSAADLFDRRGFHQTTMDDIAIAVGIKKPTLYHYVTSKDEILSQIHDQFYELLVLEQSGRLDRGLSYDELIHETIRDIIRLMATHRSYVRVFFEHHRELPEPYRRVLEPKRDEYFRLIVGYIQAGIDDGRYAIESAELGALALFGMCNWAYTWFKVDGLYSADEVADRFWSWLIAGFTSGEQSTVNDRAAVQE